MSNVCHRSLINLGSVALNLSLNVGSRQFHITRLAVSTHFNISSPLKKGSSICSKYIVSSQLYQITRCSITSDQQQTNKETERTEDCSPESTPKESYQKYHRQQYERKRNEYHNSRTNQDQPAGENGGLSEQQMTHYQRLNVDPGADLTAIKTAYYSLSKIYHPDIVGTEDSNTIENFRRITESYDVLSDQRLRAEYDKQLNSNSVPAIDFVSRQRHTNQNYNIIFRSRNADMIFKFRQDAALLREKEKNPQKFRAGVFVAKENQHDQQVNIQELGERMRQLDRSIQRGSSKMDGSDFYRMHLYDTIARKHSDMGNLSSADTTFRTSPDMNKGTIVENLVIVAGVLLLITVIILSQSLAIFLDKKLESDEAEKFIDNR